MPDCIAVHPVDLSPWRRWVPRLAAALVAASVTVVARADAVLASVDPEQTVSDPERTRVITIAIVAMVVAGVLVLAVTVWFWRSTRPEPPALAPLEVMGERGFVRADHDEQQRRLDKARPPGGEAEADGEPAAIAPPVSDAADAPVEPAPPAEPEAPAPEPETDADAVAEEHHDHTPEGDERPSPDGDEAPQPAIDPLLGRFQ